MNCSKCGAKLLDAQEIGLFCPTEGCDEDQGTLTKEQFQKIKDRTDGKLYMYCVSAGNPEGTDFTITVQHEKQYSQEEFQDIAEQAFCYAMDKQYTEDKYASVSCCGEGIYDYLKTLGFIDPPETVEYYLEPHWGKDQIKSKELLEKIARKDKFDDPEIQE